MRTIKKGCPVSDGLFLFCVGCALKLKPNRCFADERIATQRCPTRVISWYPIFFEPGTIATIKRSLRRTLVLHINIQQGTIRVCFWVLNFMRTHAGKIKSVGQRWATLFK